MHLQWAPDTARLPLQSQSCEESHWSAQRHLRARWGVGLASLGTVPRQVAQPDSQGLELLLVVSPCAFSPGHSAFCPLYVEYCPQPRPGLCPAGLVLGALVL